MRLSRKAGLLACGVRWNKYSCTIYSVFDGYICNPSAWLTIQSGTDPNYSHNGHSSFPSIEWSDFHNCYIYYQQGEKIDISPHEPGTVYECPDPETLWQYTVYTTGYYTIREQTINTQPSYRSAYSIGAITDTVRAAKGEHPDADNGYTYVTVYDGYTIMEDPDGNLYAYEKA